MFDTYPSIEWDNESAIDAFNIFLGSSSTSSGSRITKSGKRQWETKNLFEDFFESVKTALDDTSDPEPIVVGMAANCDFSLNGGMETGLIELFKFKVGCSYKTQDILAASITDPPPNATI